MSLDLAYAELGLPPGASESEVRAAWRRLVSRWHPDRNASPEAVALMQRINAAYELIRLATLAGAPDVDGAGHDADADADAGAGTGAGSAKARPAAPRRTLRRKLRLTLEEAALGCTKVLRGTVTDSCAACGGLGKSVPEACPDCKGAGIVHGSAWFGWLSTQWTCQACNGAGVKSRDCEACEGKGERSSAYRRRIVLPAGLRRGDILDGEQLGTPDDDFDGRLALELEIEIEIARHRLFEAGAAGTLHCEMPVDGFAWIANAWIDVPTLTGLQQMRLQRGRRGYRLRGQGLPLERGGSARGDYLVTVVPTFPDTLSARQQALLERLVQSSNDPDARAASAPLRAWQDKIETWNRSRAAGRTADESTEDRR